jgi:hypothetical protein
VTSVLDASAEKHLSLANSGQNIPAFPHFPRGRPVIRESFRRRGRERRDFQTLSQSLPYMHRSGNAGNSGNVFAATGTDGAISLDQRIDETEARQGDEPILSSSRRRLSK